MSWVSKRRAVGAALGIAWAALTSALAAGCDVREQKPKVAPFGTVAWIGEAAAQQADLVVPPSAVAGAMAPVDEAFALFIASSSLAELEGASIVLKNSTNEDVRDFAQKMARDHTRMTRDLKRIVAPRGLTLPVAPTGRHADMVTKLTGVNPKDVDDAFMRRFGIDAHKEAIVLVERHLIEGESPELKLYAQQTLTLLREHLAAAQKLAHAAGSR